ncbi:MAG: hypothetical protein O2960_05795 [Verrucomicrobia bacterium]|nr:hypothetical protein [Verrucomicrobiota bacterium]
MNPSLRFSDSRTLVSGRFLFSVWVIFLFAFLGDGKCGAASVDQETETILNTAGVSGGFAVYLGPGNAGLLTALHNSGRFMVHGLATDEANNDAVRKSIRDNGVHGSVTLDRAERGQLPFVDNMVNLFVAENLGEFSPQEIDRVLVPEGVALVRKDGRWTKFVKPRPDGIDEWTRFSTTRKGTRFRTIQSSRRRNGCSGLEVRGGRVITTACRA